MGIGDHQLDAAQTASGELAQKLGPEGLGLRRSDIHAEHLAAAVAVDADRNDYRRRDDAPTLARLHVSRIDPQIGPVALDRAAQEGFHLLVNLLAQPADLALGDAGHAHRFDEIVDRSGRDAMHISLLHHRGERLFGQAARLQEDREVAALAQLGDAQLYGAGACRPQPVPVAVALVDPLRAALAMGGAGQPLDLQLHQALGSEADHFAQKIGVGALFQKRAKGHHLVGHRWILGSVAWFSDQTLPMIRDDHRKPLAHYGAPQGRARSRLAPPSYTTSRDATQFKRAIREFESASDTADIAVIYYAGHGIEINGLNYLIPIDAILANDRD